MRAVLAVALLVVGTTAYLTFPILAGQQAGQKAAGDLAGRVQDLNLTDQQEAKIEEIQKAFAPKVQEAGKELAAVVKEEVEKVRDVLTPEQRMRPEAAREERQERRAEGLAQRMAHCEELDLTDDEIAKFEEIRKEFRPKIEKAMNALHGILTDDQKKVRQEGLTAGKKHREIVESLNLTGEQKEKIQTVGKEVATLFREEMEKIRDVINAEQNEKLQDLKEERKERVRDRAAHRISELKELNLTDDQKTKIADIRKEYRPKVHDAGNKLRGAVREEVEAIVLVIKG
jgi:Spy/CpxP family protein refolding chaperone